MKSNYFGLIKEVALSDFKLRYQGSVLGILWSFLRPLLMFLVLYLVFSEFVRFEIPDYPFYLLLGIVLWNFFTEATTAPMHSLVAKAELIKKISFSRSTIVVSAVVTAFLNLILNLLVFAVIFHLYGAGFSLSALFLLIPIILLFGTALGVGFFLTALNARFKDISHIWDLLLQVGFWLTPIVYSVQMIPPRYSILIKSNPVAHIITSSREAVFSGRIMGIKEFGFLVLITAIILGLGYFVFKEREPYFAEEL